MAKNWFKFPYLKNSFDLVNLDLENSGPQGGPINDPSSGYSHKYTPTNKYLDKYQGARSNNSNFGIKGKEILPNSSFETTGLDIENPKAGTKQGGSGGPNRTNSNNIPSGQYINIGTNNMFGWKFTNSGIGLKDKNNEIVTTQLQQWTPSNTYMNYISENINDL